MPVRGIPFFCARALGVVIAALLAASVAGCEIPNQGIPPTPATLNFPIALALSAPRAGTNGPQFLLVVSSNYDARYNQGSIMSLDMDAIYARLDDIRAHGRSPDPLHPFYCSNAAAWDDPSVECQIAEASEVLAPGTDGLHAGAEVWIDSFAAGITRTAQPEGDRFYLPVRGGASHGLTWIDLDTTNGAIGCAQAAGSLRCGDLRRTTPIDNGCPGRANALVGDPSAVVAMNLGDVTGEPADDGRDVVLMINRGTAGGSSAALYLDDGTGLGRHPTLTHVLTGLPSDAINAELEPATLLTWIDTASPVSTRATRILARVGVFIDDDNRSCSQSFGAPSVFLDGIASGFDTRDVAFDSDGRYAYVLSRSPESVLTIDQQGTPFITGNASIVEVDDVCFGPSRMARIRMENRDYLVATCFDGRTAEVFSTQPTQLVSVIPGFDGPYAIAIDEVRRLAIIADFKTSVIRFVDLDPVTRGGNARVLGRVGTPRTRMGFP